MNFSTLVPDAKPAADTAKPTDASLPALLLQRAASHGDRAIMRKKHRGIWKQITWAELATHARHVGMALATLGIVPGDRVAVLAETSPDWTYADLGILGARGVSVGIYPTSSPEQVAHILRDSGAAVLFVENEEQLDKALEARASCPALRRIVVFDMTGLRDLDDPTCESLAAFLARGAAHDAADPAAWEAGIAAIAGDDLALLVYTAGTAGPPLGAMLTHESIVAQAANGAALFGQREGDERLAALPMAHVAERVLGLYQSLAAGTITNYAEAADTVLENLREVQPTVQIGVPRFWERFHARIGLAIADATWLQRLAYRWAMGLGQLRAEARLAGRPVSPLVAAGFRIGEWLVLRSIRRQIGIDRLRFGIVGAAPTSADLIRWYLALGVDLLEAYAVTECAGLAAATPPGHIRLGAVGKPVPYGEMAATQADEIVIRGVHVFQGYWQQQAATERALRDNWLHTGDIGVIDDGYLRLTGRMSELIVVPGGASIAPSAIETALKVSPYIAEAMVIGAERHFLTCLVLVDPETIEKWAQDHAVPFTSFASLAQTDAVRALIEAEVARVNARFADGGAIRSFRLIDRRLEPDDPELTPTMKLRRRYVQEKYASLIETMYSQS